MHAVINMKIMFDLDTTTPIEMIKTLIVDDHKIILDSLSLLIGLMDNIEVVATINDSREVIPYLEANEVNVLMTDLNMPYMTGIELSQKVRELFPLTNILMLTVNDNPSLISDAYKMGIKGYVMKKAKREELEQAINTVSRGELYYGQEVMKTLLTDNGQQLNNEKLKLLTSRELEIINLIAQEKSSSDIARELFISKGTVEVHRSKIFKKLGVRNVVGVIKFAMKYNLIDE